MRIEAGPAFGLEGDVDLDMANEVLGKNGRVVNMTLYRMLGAHEKMTATHLMVGMAQMPKSYYVVQSDRLKNLQSRLMQ